MAPVQAVESHSPGEKEEETERETLQHAPRTTCTRPPGASGGLGWEARRGDRRSTLPGAGRGHQRAAPALGRGEAAGEAAAGAAEGVGGTTGGAGARWDPVGPPGTGGVGWDEVG